MFCEKCGNLINEEAIFCNKCGNSLKIAVVENPHVSPVSIDGSYLLKPDESFGGFWVRAGAYMIDTALSVLVGIIIIKFFELEIDYLILISYAIFLVYILLSTALYSTTLGKKSFGLKVVNKKDGTKISFWKSAGRCLSYFLSCFLLYAGFWTAGLDSKKQGWHDKIASTFVIRDKKIGFVLGIFLTLASIGILFMLFSYSENDVSNKNSQNQGNTNNVSKNETVEKTQEIDPVTKADYQEGYKAGYVDGRASKGQLGDNYSEPATEERKDAYFVGYLDGFLKGCKEGDFDCSEVERAINSLGEEQEGSVNLIPSSVN